MMKYKIVTDTHFNHKRLIDLDHRQGDFEFKMWTAMLKLTDQDVLIHLGDICIGEDALVHEAIADLDAHSKILVRGNHDQKSDGWYLRHGWDLVVDEFRLHKYGTNIVFSHEPIDTDPSDIDINIHGHLHGNTHRLTGRTAQIYNPQYHFDCAPELRGYKLLDLEWIIDTHQL